MRTTENKKFFYKRTAMAAGGIFLCGISVSFLKLSVCGTDPFQSFMAGLDAFLPLPFGTLHILVSICLVIFALISDRHFIGLGTILNLFLLGYIVEFSSALLHKIFAAPSFAVQIISFVIGISMICISSSFYFTANMGVSPYDAVALILTNKWRSVSFRYVRLCTDLICVSLGCALYLLSGGSLSGLSSVVGFGTLFTALFMGTFIEYFNRTLARPFLYGRSDCRKSGGNKRRRTYFRRNNAAY